MKIAFIISSVLLLASCDFNVRLQKNNDLVDLKFRLLAPSSVTVSK